MPAPNSLLPIRSALVAYDDDNACDEPTRLRVLQLYITAKAGVLAQTRARLARLLQRPCFDGVQSPGERRRAPPRIVVAWRMEGRIVAFAQDKGMADAAVLTLVIPGGAAGPGASPLRDEMLAGLPSQCR